MSEAPTDHSRLDAFRTFPNELPSNPTGDPALGGRDVRASLQELGWDTRRDVRRARIERARGQPERRRRAADQRRDRVLELRPLHHDVGGLRARGVELRLGLGDVGLRRRAALEAVRRELKRRLEGFHRLVQELLLGVGSPQLEVVHRQLGLKAELGSLEIGGGGLGLVLRRRHRPPHPAPQVDLVGHVEGQQQIAAATRARVRWKEGPVRGVADGGAAHAGGDRGKQRGPVETDECPGFTEPGLRDLQILVGRGDLLLKLAELGITEDRPPLAPWQVIAWFRNFPALRLLVGRRQGRRRSRIVRAYHAAAKQEGGQPDEAGALRPHGRVTPGARAIRTRVPLVRESDGATMTWSVGWSPERTSTVSP